MMENLRNPQNQNRTQSNREKKNKKKNRGGSGGGAITEGELFGDASKGNYGLK